MIYSSFWYISTQRWALKYKNTFLSQSRELILRIIGKNRYNFMEIWTISARKKIFRPLANQPADPILSDVRDVCTLTDTRQSCMVYVSVWCVCELDICVSIQPILIYWNDIKNIESFVIVHSTKQIWMLTSIGCVGWIIIYK